MPSLLWNKNGVPTYEKITVMAAILLTFMLSACDRHQEIKRENLVATDLSTVNIDDISLNGFIDEIDLTPYTAVPLDRFEEKENTYYYDYNNHDLIWIILSK